MIAYDPFGRWLGKNCSELPGDCAGNYDFNSRSAASHKGQWVFYDFDKYYSQLVTVGSLGGVRQLATETLTPPDLTDDEPADIGTYLGSPLAGVFRVYVPLARR
jgi:hypothetical protein